MRKSFLKRALALVLAGTMIIGPAVAIPADEGDGIIPTPELQVDLPNATDGFGQVSATNNLPDIGFNTGSGTLTATTVREAVFESEDDDGHNGFNGVYYFPDNEDIFKNDGRFPMVIAFDVKLDESITALPSNEGDIIGKMDNDYGVQILRDRENFSGKDGIMVYTSGGKWATCRVSLELGTLNEWTSVVVLYDGHTFWISVDGGLTFKSDIPSKNFALPANDSNSHFGIGYNATKSGGRSMRDGIYLDNVKMYRSDTEVSADDTAGSTAENAAQLATNLMTSGTLVIETEYIAPPYTVGETTWYEGTEATGTEATTYVPGKTYTFSTTFTARDGYTFSADNVPTEIETGYGSIGVTATVAEGGNTMTVTGTYSDGTFLNVETVFWDQEMAAGTIGNQTDADTWLYQIKRVDSDEWENIPDTAFHSDYLNGTWMQSEDGSNSEYGWAKINRTEVTCTFKPVNGTAKYQSAAYTWNADEAGYYRASVATPIGEAGSSFTMYIAHATADDANHDGEILLESAQYSTAGTFTSRIAKVNEGDNIRFVATNGWATGFEPVIQQVTVKEYAQQWLDDNADILASYDDGLYTSDTVEAVTTAKESLDAALEEEPADLDKIEAALTSLQTAVGNLQEREFDFNVQTDYWDYSKLKGTLASQTEDDIWYYQVRTSDSWENIAENYFDSTALNGEGVWMSNGNNTPEPYYYASIRRTQLTPCLDSSDPDHGVAFAWKATKSGYARMRFANDITLNTGKADVTLTIAKGTAEVNTETLLVKELDSAQGTYAAGDFTTEYVKVSAGDYLRISAAKADNDVYGVAPVVEMLTVKEYAKQYLAEMETVDTSDKTTASVEKFQAAMTDLQSALSNEPEDEDAIVAAIEALEQAEANLEDGVYTVTYTKHNTTTGTTSTEKIKARYNDQITIVTDVPVGQQFAGWSLSLDNDGGSAEDGVIVSQEKSYTFYVAGNMTVTATFVGASAPVEMNPAASISNVNITKREDNENYDVRFVVQLSVPENCGLYEAGLLWDIQTINDDILNTENGPQVLGTVRKVNVTQVSSSYQYSVTIRNVPAGTTIYGRAFAKIFDDNSDVQEFEWLYSPEKTAVVQVPPAS